MVELNASDDSSLLYVRVHIVEALLDSLLKILGDTIKSEGTQTTKCQSADLMVSLLDIHPECVDGEDGQFLVLLCVVNQIKIDHLFHNYIFCAGGFHHLWVKSRHINAQSHVSDDLLDYITSLVDVFVNAHCTE